jgi:hypothetical protein
MSWRTRLSPQKKQAAADRVHTTPTLTEGPLLDEWLGTKSPKKKKRMSVMTENRPIAVFPGGRTGAVGRRPIEVSSSQNHVDGHVYDVLQFDEQNIGYGEMAVIETNTQSRHQRRRRSEWHTWNTQVIPSLIEPYAELLRVTKSLRDAPPHHSLDRSCNCYSKAQLDVMCISFICKSETTVFKVV